MGFRRIIGTVILLIVIFGGSSSECGSVSPEKGLLSIKTLGQKQRSEKKPAYSSHSSKNSKATILKVTRRDLYTDHFHGRNQRFQNWLIADKIRVESLQNRFKTLISNQFSPLSQTGIPITPGVKLQTLNYIVTLTFGARNLTVIVDTGSDLTWVQCQPCACYNQPEPLFNPSVSPSYISIPCNSSSCQSLQIATGNSGQCGKDLATCNYMVSYGDGSYTRGELGREKLILGSTQIDDFVFGCGRNNKGLFGGASGLMGLGRSDLSLIHQTFDKFSGVFSYCLPSTDGQATGSLIFGDDFAVYANSSPISYTTMVPNPYLTTFYFLNLTDISIGGIQVQTPSLGNNKILIDSGTVITRLWPSAYKVVKTEFLKQFSGYPTTPGFSILDTCFNLSTYDEVSIPTIKLHFQGEAELDVDLSGIFYFVKRDASQVCLALASLASEDEIGIIGNYQQRNTRVIYDTKESKVGFAKETCSFN